MINYIGFNKLQRFWESSLNKYQLPKPTVYFDIFRHEFTCLQACSFDAWLQELQLVSRLAEDNKMTHTKLSAQCLTQQGWLLQQNHGGRGWKEDVLTYGCLSMEEGRLWEKMQTDSMLDLQIQSGLFHLMLIQ